MRDGITSDEVHDDIEAMKTVAAALEPLPQWRRALALAFIVDRELGYVIAEKLWAEARTLRLAARAEYGRSQKAEGT
jgi:hypothetical protein